MRIGIVGTGAMGKTHAKAWRTTPATLAGFVSRGGKSTLAQDYDAPVFTSVEALLPHVDVVDICTPTHLHHAQALQAAQAGKHIVCEKPLARTQADAQAIVQACIEHGVRLCVAHVLRYFPDYANAHDAILRGQIGRPRHLMLRRAVGIAKHEANSWFDDPAISGGVLLDLIIHDFDFARWVAGPIDTVTVTHATPDLAEATVLLRHTSGAVTQVDGAWNLPPGRFETAAQIEGEHGVIAFDNAKPAPADVPDPYALQAQDFYTALSKGRTPRVTAQDALAALDISLTALAQVWKK